MRRYFLATTALVTLGVTAGTAQPFQPADMSITPTTVPEVLQVLDNTGAWVPVGSVDPALHSFSYTGSIAGSQITGPISGSQITTPINGAAFLDPRDPPYNAKCDGTTDDNAALVAAVAAAKAASKSLRVPNAICYSALALNFGVLSLVGATPLAPGLPSTPGPTIACAASIAAPCVTLGTPLPGGQGGTVRDVAFGFIGTPVAGDRGLQVQGVNTVLDRTLVYNAWDGYYFYSGLSAHASWLYTLGITHDHVVQDSFPEVYINQARLSGAVRSNAFFGFTGNDPNSFNCVQCQLNLSSIAPKYVWDFFNLTAQVNGDYRLIDSIIDLGNDPNATAVIHTDTTGTCFRCIWDNVSIYGASATNVPFFAINSTATWFQSAFVNSNFFVGPFTLPHIGIVGLRLANLFIQGPVTIDGTGSSRVNVDNIETNSSFTVQGGPWGGLNLSNIYSVGVYSDVAATGVVRASGVPKTVWTPQLQFGLANVGMTMANSSGFASRQPDGSVSETFGLVLTALGSSTGVPSVAGAPYLCAPWGGYGSVGLNVVHAANMTGLTEPVMAYPRSNVTDISIGTYGATGVANLTQTNFTNTSILGGTISCVPP